MHASPALPLRQYEIFHTRDVDEARERVARIFCPHALSPCGPRGALDARQHSVRLHRDVSLNYVQYGPGVDIEPGYLGDFYLLQIPLRGGATVRCGTQQVMADPQLASLPSPSECLRMRWHDDSPHLIVRVSQAAVQRHLEQLAQAPLHRPLVFDLGLRLDQPALAPLRHFISYLCATLEDGQGFGATPLAEQAESHLVSSLLLLAPHNHSAALEADSRRSLLPRSVRRAQDLMRSQAAEPASLAQLCAQLGISARALQAAFREHTGQSPMAYWRELRLDRARAALQAAAPGTSVSRVAMDFGFLHLGHFAAHYHRRFGETPAQTLRAAQRA